MSRSQPTRKMPFLLKLTGFQKTSSLIYFSLTVCIFALFCIQELRHLRIDGQPWTTTEGSLTPEIDLLDAHGIPGSGYSNAGERVDVLLVKSERWVGEDNGGLRMVREREWWEFWDSPRGGGEGWLYREKVKRVAQQVHLWSVVPAGILLPLQFLPIMRLKYMTLHRWSGKALFAALMIGNITALNLGSNAFGGTLDTLAFTLVLAFSNTFSMFKAWKGIRDLRLDVHRAWVIRTWGFASSILSLRMFMIILIILISIYAPNAYHQTLSCAKLDYMFPAGPSLTALHSRYPACAKLTTEQSLSKYVAVACKIDRTRPEEMAAFTQLVFGLAGFLGFLVNTLLVECYLSYTIDEDEKLKKVSALRRKSKGWIWDEGKGEKMS